MSSQVSAWLLISVAWRFAHADLPVHCLRHQIVGEWEFVLGPTSTHRPSCGHRRPDSPELQPALSLVARPGAETLKLSLRDPATALAADGSQGTWTMIYDEAFEVAIGGRVFLAFSKFDWVEGPEGRTNVSHCDATQVGWYRDAARSHWGCYVGRKTSASAAPAVTQAASPRAGAEPEASAQAALARRAAALRDIYARGASRAFLSPDSDEDEALVQEPTMPASAGFDRPMAGHFQRSVAGALNFLQLGWTAAAYGFFEGKTPRELNKFAGVRRHIPRNAKKAAPDSGFASLLAVASGVRRAVSGEDKFDWRAKDGHNWLTPVVNQGDCGSCYTISTIHMLTARHRIKSQDVSKPAFSVSFPLYCSEYNQGCDGGYGFLQSKWSEDVGLIPEHCLGLSTGGGSCHALPHCALGGSRFRATNHHYVGGFYGASEERLIREELVANGPVVMSFEPQEDFMYYKAGVYRSSPGKIHQEWEQVDHAVLLIGYGSDAGQQFWTMQNSWGTDWGEAGYFRMARGQDESGCESIVVAAEVIEESSNEILDSFLASLPAAA